MGRVIEPREDDWERLRELRALFLAEAREKRAQNYWRTRADLEAYDRSFAQRIGWKWQALWAEMKERGLHPQARRFLDWGCGTGVAARTLCENFAVDAVSFFDRSDLAMGYAQAALAKEHPQVPAGKDPAEALLLSHVLNELSAAERETLFAQACGYSEIYWLEPGSYELSRELGRFRQRFLEKGFQAVAPCPFAQGSCGMLSPENERHWCHHFARPPQEVFHSRAWAHWAKALSIDLGRVPYSFLVLWKKNLTHPAGLSRVIGEPRQEKGRSRFLECHESQVRERILPKRADPELWREFRDLSAPPAPLFFFEQGAKPQEVSGARRLPAK